MERHRVEALQSYKTAMAGVTLPTTDEHLSTFHAFSSEDALERLREAMRCSDSGGAPVDSASAAAAEREVQDQIAEYVTEAQPSAHDPRTLVQARQLRGGATDRGAAGGRGSGRVGRTRGANTAPDRGRTQGAAGARTHSHA